MCIENKIKTVDELKEKILTSKCFYIIDASGLKVHQVNNFRKNCFEKKIFYKVVKNTLIKKTLEKINSYKNIDFKILKGFSGILIPKHNNKFNLPAKIILDFRKNNNIKKPILKIAFIEKDFFLHDLSLKKIINIKSKNQMINEIIFLLKSSSLYRILNLLKKGKNKIFKIFQNVKNKNLKLNKKC